MTVQQNNASPVRSILRERLSLLVVVLLACAYAGYFSYFTVLKHYTFHTFGYDLGIFMQHLWTTLHGHGILYTSVSESSGLGWHFSPILFLLLPLYAAAPYAETLLVLQSCVLATGSVAVYLIAGRRVSPWLAAVFAAAYLLYPALHGVNSSDFHPVALSIPLLLFTFHFLESGRLRCGFVFAVLSMMCKENVPLVVAMMSFYLLVRDVGLRTPVSKAWESVWQPRLLPITTLGILAVVWFCAALFAVIPHFSQSGGYPYFGRYGGSGLALIGNLRYASPLKLEYVRDLFSPLLFLSVGSPGALLIAVPGLAQNLLARNPNQVMIWFQYSAIIVPGMFIAAVLTAGRMKAWLDSGGRWVMVALLLSAAIIWSASLSPAPLALSRDMPQRTFHHDVVDAAIALVPDEASVHAQNDLYPHLCHRLYAYCTLSPIRIDFFRYYRYSMNQFYERSDGVEFEYILVDDSNEQSTLRMADAGSLERLDKEYGVYAAGDGVFLYRKGYEGDATDLVELAADTTHDGVLSQ